MSDLKHSEPSDGLSLRNVSRRFGARVAVDDVTLDVRRSEVLCILGPSGCGKSTTLRIAAGLEKADAGRVFIAGRLVEGQEDGHTRYVPPEERGVGLMFQDYALFPHLSVKDNIVFGLKGMAPAESTARVEEEIERVGLSHLAHAYPHTLSGGEQQRVALARMLAPRPLVVLMDEPFSGLDSSLRESLRMATLKHLRDVEAAVVIVTHDPDEAMRLGDQVALIRQGRIVQSGTPLEIFSHPADSQAAAMLGGGSLLRSKVKDGLADSPFGPVAASHLPDGAAAEVYYRAASIQIGNEGILARIRAIRPSPAGLEIEAEIGAAAPSEGVGSPILVLAMAPIEAKLAVGADIRLNANPQNAFVFPCLDKACQA
ncbi:MAG: ABC transporter ATP-binding protein [Micropepsaceae bacterium]